LLAKYKLLNQSIYPFLGSETLGKTALVIDDDLSVLRNFKRLLIEDGYEVWGVKTGKEALAEVQQRSFDVMLIDFKLPDMDGTDLVEKMGDKAAGAIKLMITGFPTIEASIRALDLGIDSFVEKPVRSEDLLTLINQKLKEKQEKKSQ
jgi:DNA-binding NtrC family response regulator